MTGQAERLHEAIDGQVVHALSDEVDGSRGISEFVSSDITVRAIAVAIVSELGVTEEMVSNCTRSEQTWRATRYRKEAREMKAIADALSALLEVAGEV